jgi:DNA-binding SARP family transcriptional activator
MSSPTPLLALTTLGGVAVRRLDGVPSHLRMQRRRLALLAVLAAGGSRGLSRDRLLLLLWPEADAESARNNLKQALFTLRRDLGGEALGGEAHELRLNPGVWQCDRWAFEMALADDDPGKAVELYAGPFLDGFHVGGEAEEFERWADHERAALAAAYRGALQKLADRAEAAGELAAACHWWRRLASLDPLDGRIAFGLISATARSGNPAGALQLARAHDDLLRAEASIGPDPSVARLVERIRSGTLPGAPPAATLVGSRGVLERLRSALAGQYVIEGEVRRPPLGGATRSYMATDARHGRAVVLKVLLPSLASQLDTRRFLREIALTARLQHPHLVPLLESGQIDGTPWFTAPALPGGSLRERLSADPFVPLAEALRLSIEVADALDYAHRHGVVHRDVTPENILLAESHALLGNLGVARALDAASTSELTETGMLVGSPAYMSPEQAAGQVKVDARSDVYSLACVLYEMLAGNPLHSGPTPQAIMAKRAWDLISPRLDSLTGCPPAVVQTLDKALAVAPQDRFASAAAFAAALSAMSP